MSASNDAPLFDALRALKRQWTGKPQIGLTASEVAKVKAALKASEGPAEPPKATASPPALGGKATLAGIVGAVAATSLFLGVPEDEGTRYQAYRDIAGIWTICQGDTKNVRSGMRETPEGCRRRLESQLIAHAAPVMACSPRLKEQGRDWQRASAVSLAYNIGVKAYCGSSVDRRFDAGDWRGGCNAFLAWNKARVNGQLRPVQGLTNRRQRERAICLRGVA